MFLDDILMAPTYMKWDISYNVYLLEDINVRYGNLALIGWIFNLKQNKLRVIPTYTVYATQSVYMNIPYTPVSVTIFCIFPLDDYCCWWSYMHADIVIPTVLNNFSSLTQLRYFKIFLKNPLVIFIILY